MSSLHCKLLVNMILNSKAQRSRELEGSSTHSLSPHSRDAAVVSVDLMLHDATSNFIGSCLIGSPWQIPNISAQELAANNE